MTDARFNQRARLRQPSQFKRVFATGRRHGDRYFTVIAAENGGDLARLGLAVSRRNARRAVDRNRLKRLARELFRGQQSRLKGLDLIVITRQGAAALENGDICVHLHTLLEKIRRSCELL